MPVDPMRRSKSDALARPGLESLAMGWWAALDAARAALHSAGPYIGAQEQSARAGHLAAERSDVIHLMQAIAREQHAAGWLVRWLAAPALTRRMLGLPDGVAACVFDLDGVLTTSAAMHAAAWAETLDPFLVEQAERSHREFIPFDQGAEYEDYIAGKPRLDGVRDFLGSRGIALPGDAVRDLAERKNRLLQEHLDRQGVAAFSGSRFYLEAARAIGVHRAVVSASANTAGILGSAGLAHLIEHTVDGNTIAAEHLGAKPAPDTILAACRRLGVEPGHLAAFETTPAGVAAARAAGVRLTVGVDRTGQTGALLGDADLVIGDLAELFEHVPAD
jgi:beta-phosphoglucomutase-like phosphatase (HAD superfamily)